MRYVYNNRDTLWAKIKTSIDLSWDPSFFGPSDTEGKAGFMIDSLDAYANIYMSKAHTNSNPYISFSVNFKENFFLQVFEETFFITEHRIGSLDSLHSYIDTAAIKGKVIEDVIKFQFDTMRFDHHFKKIYYKKGIGYILMETFDNEKLEALGAKLGDGLAEAVREAGVPAEVNRCGSLLTLFFTDLPVTDYTSAKRSNTARFARFHRALLGRGVYWPPSQFEVAFVSLAHSETDIEETLTAARAALRAAR